MSAVRFDPERARALYDARMPDTIIAETIGVSKMVIRTWRKRNGLPAAYPSGSPFRRKPKPRFIRGEIEARARALHKLGHTDQTIGEKIGCSAYTVGEWRRGQRLISHGSGAPGKPATAISRAPGAMTEHRTNPAWRNDLWARAAKAVGTKLALDIVEDAISDIVLAVLDGRLHQDDIEKRARKMANRTIDAWASRYGLESLDEKRGEEEWTYYEMIPCEDQAAALRFLELNALAHKHGIDVDAVLNSESPDYNEREPWSGRGTIQRKRRLSPHYGRLGYTEIRAHEYPLVGETHLPKYDGRHA